MKGLFRIDIAVEMTKYITELNPLGRKQYLKGVGECPNDEYALLAPYFTPDLIVDGRNVEKVKLEEVKAEDINLEDYEAEKMTESPLNKMVISPKNKGKKK